MIQCANCGAYGDTSAKFCINCGTSLTESSLSVSENAPIYNNATQPYGRYDNNNQYGDFGNVDNNNQYGVYTQYRHVDNYQYTKPRKRKNPIALIIILVFGAVAVAIFGAFIMFLTRNIISNDVSNFTGEAGNIATVINSIEEDINNKDWSAAAENFTAELAYNFEYIAFIEHQTGDYLNIFDRDHYSDEELAELDSTVIEINIEDIEIYVDMAVATGVLRRTYEDLNSVSFTDIERITFNLVKVGDVWLVDTIP